MIIGYGVKNFFCFKEGAEISFKINQKCPSNISNGKSYSNMLCIKGANSSGKTNALKALSFLNHFCVDSFASKPDDSITFDSFYFNDEPTDLYIEFETESVKYRYELSLTRDVVLSEILYRKKKREVTVFKRIGDKITYTTKDFLDLGTIKKLRGNASIISTAHQYEIGSMVPIYNFFMFMSSNVNYYGHYRSTLDSESVSEFYAENPRRFKFVKRIIKKFDSGIEDIKLVPIKNDDGSERFVPNFIHRVKDKKYPISFHAESSGTQSLFTQLLLYSLVLDGGGVLILDEFDINLHPKILPHLLDLFQKDKHNKNGAQIIFSTHNTAILNYMGKYRTYLINKENNESYLYRLDEVPGDVLRNDRSLIGVYNSGKIGGIPEEW